MAAIFLEPWAKPLLVLHAATAVVLLGSLGHLAWESVYLLRGAPRRMWLARVHARVGFAVYAIQFVLGLLVYPTYRVRVRNDVFDATMPWASNLFDIKEIWAAFGMAAFVALFAISFAVRPEEPAHAALRIAFATLGILVFAIALFASVAGWLLVSWRSV